MKDQNYTFFLNHSTGQLSAANGAGIKSDAFCAFETGSDWIKLSNEQAIRAFAGTGVLEAALEQGKRTDGGFYDWPKIPLVKRLEQDYDDLRASMHS